MSSNLEVKPIIITLGLININNYFAGKQHGSSYGKTDLCHGNVELSNTGSEMIVGSGGTVVRALDYKPGDQSSIPAHNQHR